MTIYFDHERLDVYELSLGFVAWAEDLIRSVPGKYAAKDQLDRASTSAPLNIAEGNGKYSIKDRCRFLEIAYGSAVECAARLDVFLAKKLADQSDVDPGKQILHRIVSMLVKLRGSFASRVSEDKVEYEYE